MPQLLHPLPALGAQGLKFDDLVLGHVNAARFPPDRLSEVPQSGIGLGILDLALPAPAGYLCLLDAILEAGVAAAPPLDALGVEEVQLGLLLQGDPGGRLGADVAGDTVPGGAEPAGDDEGEGVGPDEEPGHGEEGASDDSRMGEVDLGRDGAVAGDIRVVRGEEGRRDGADRGEGGGQGEDVGQALGGLVGPVVVEALQVGQVEGLGYGLEAAGPDNAAAGLI